MTPSPRLPRFPRPTVVSRGFRSGLDAARRAPGRLASFEVHRVSHSSGRKRIVGFNRVQNGTGLRTMSTGHEAAESPGLSASEPEIAAPETNGAGAEGVPGGTGAAAQPHPQPQPDPKTETETETETEQKLPPLTADEFRIYNRLATQMDYFVRVCVVDHLSWLTQLPRHTHHSRSASLPLTKPLPV